MQPTVCSWTNEPGCERPFRQKNLTVLGGEAASATTGLHGVWILEREATARQIGVEVDFGAIEIQIALLVDNDTNAMMFFHQVVGFVIRVGEVERVLEATASATDDADSHVLQLRAILFGNHSLDFVCGIFRQNY